MSRSLEVVKIKETPQTLTGTFADYGDEQKGENVTGISLNVYLTIGTSTSVQVKIVSMWEERGDEIELPLVTPDEQVMTVYPAVYQFATNDTQKMKFAWVCNHQMKYWKVQVKDSAGGTGTIDKIIAEVETE